METRHGVQLQKMADANIKPNVREESEKVRQVIAALGFVFVCVVIGLPLWWQTTRVYRVQLPYDEITKLNSHAISHTVRFTVSILDEDIDDKTVQTLRDQLEELLQSNADNKDVLSVSYRADVRRASDWERMKFHKSQSIQDFNCELSSMVNDVGEYMILVVPEISGIHPQQGLVTTKRVAYVHAQNDLTALSTVIVRIIQDLFVNEATMLKAFTSALGLREMQPDKKSMRALRSHSSYDVTFTLLNPQPDIVRVHWDIKKAVDDYLHNLLHSLSDYVDIRIKSQYVHCTEIGVRPTHDKTSNGYKLTHDNLPHVINAIEPYLDSHISNNPHLNFIVYVPSRAFSPLNIFDDTGRQSETNAFISPRWGGFLVHNVAIPANSSMPFDVHIEPRAMMRVFTSQLRLLLGFDLQEHTSELTVWQSASDIISQWEIDVWLRKRCMENIATASTTLQSLAQLLEKISNIVINDDIGNEVENAVSAIKDSQQLLSSGTLSDAFLSSQLAVIHSEKAFFDPSLLELLYFPEDQKFAIYIPLFLPVSIPVLMSLLHAVKWMRSKKEKIA